MTFPDDVPVLTDGVVTLRAHTPDDAQGVFEQCQDPVSRRWTTVPLDYTLEDGALVRHRPGAGGLGGGPQGLRRRGGRRRPGRRGSAAPSSCVTRAAAGPRSRTARTRGPAAAGLMHRALRAAAGLGVRASAACGPSSGGRTRATGPSRRTAWRLGFTCDGTVERWLPQRGELLDAWVGVLHADDERAPRADWLEVPRLEGDGVVLREPRVEDADRIVSGLPGRADGLLAARAAGAVHRGGRPRLPGVTAWSSGPPRPA